ncbi:MAG: peptidylprolyl isomerase [Ignavibacteriae bacterium]|nr:peptidylprolyl isomerase [Ignavibacteriota bacterium]
MTTIFSVFAGLFVIYIVFDWGMDITGIRRSSRQAESFEIGKINGEPILSKDFAELVRRATENQKAQTGVDPDEAQQKLIRDQIWNYLLEQKLYDEEIKRFGVSVSDQEIYDWVRSDTPPELLRRQFIDSTGTFNRAAYEAAILDPRNRNAMIAAEAELRRQRLMAKLYSIVLASVQVTEEEVLHNYVDQNIKYEADYILLDPNRLIRDDEITLTDEDLRRYYNDNSADYKVEATRKLKYVLFRETASEKDTQDVIADMEDILRRANAGADFDELVKTYSETPPNDTVFHKHGELSQEKENVIFSAKVGDIIDPVNEYDGYHLIKVLEFRSGKDEFIRASHILIKVENNDSAKALKEANEISVRAKRGEDFTELAKQYSKDPGSGARGGDLGWFGKGRMVKEFEEAAYKAKIGQIVGPVRSQFGYHIIKVLGRDNREARFSDIHIAVHISPKTRSELSQRAQDFAYLAKQGDFQKEAELNKYNVVETLPFQKDAVIPGIGSNSTLNRFAFTGTLGDISEPITLSNGWGVFMISEVKEAGIRPFDEVKSTVETRLKREKKIEKLKILANELLQMVNPNGDLQNISAKRPDLPVQHLAPFTLSGSIPGIGRDLILIGGISTLNPGQISKPIEGQRGVCIVKLLSKTPFDSTAYNSQKENLRSQLLSEKRNRFLSEWSDQLKKSADIVDNRDLFYR